MGASKVVEGLPGGQVQKVLLYKEGSHLLMVLPSFVCPFRGDGGWEGSQ